MGTIGILVWLRSSISSYSQFSYKETPVHRDKAKNSWPCHHCRVMTYSVEQWGVDISLYPFATLEEAVFQASVAMRWKLSSTALPWQGAWKPYFGFIWRLWGLQWLSHWLLCKCVSAFWFMGKTEVTFERRQGEWPETIPAHLNNNTMLLIKIRFSVKYSIATCP